MSQQKTGIDFGIAICIALIWGLLSIPALADDPPPTVQEGAEENSAEEPGTEVEGEESTARQEAIPVFNEGVAAFEVEDLPTALEHFLRASDIDPDFPEAWIASAAVAMASRSKRSAKLLARSWNWGWTTSWTE